MASHVTRTRLQESGVQLVNGEGGEGEIDVGITLSRATPRVIGSGDLGWSLFEQEPGCSSQSVPSWTRLCSPLEKFRRQGEKSCGETGLSGNLSRLEKFYPPSTNQDYPPASLQADVTHQLVYNRGDPPAPPTSRADPPAPPTTEVTHQLRLQPR
ncbi:hypothetical protein PoB_001870800 [Plakobranchus ocellatus]|uniref:Uncharacterized protein n=1 Tax=Plakobranchus ocellatus TaxID=259542 RepID=A0AAV3ZC95_9GAST|nr:hypothetical protein PoB_001870800 [Plakobranchus ocellatus]